MAQIKVEDIQNMSNDELRQCYNAKDITTLPSPIKEYILKGKDSIDMENRLNRFKRLMNMVVVERFINNEFING